MWKAGASVSVWMCISVWRRLNGRTVFQANADFSEKYLSANGAAARDALVAEVIKQRKKDERELRRRIAEDKKNQERRRFIQLRKKFVGG